MAEYIENVIGQTSKLDWAFPFQRTGAFPLDRSVLFSTLADAQAYAKGDGSDERALGGTSYVGQVISVLDEGEVAAYIITKTRSLMKLAATTASGDLSSDIAKLQGDLSSLNDKVIGNTDSIKSVKTEVEKNTAAIAAIGDVDKKINEAIAAADHLSRKIVDSVEDINVDADDAEKYIYMVPSDSAEEGDKYDEYMVLEIAGSKVVERVGDWAVDLSGYAKTEDLDGIQASVANKVDKVADSRLMTNAEGEKLAGIAEGAQKNVINSASAEFSISEAGELSVKSVSMAKVDGLAAKFDGYVKNDSNKLLTDAQKTKLEALELDEDGNVSVDAEKISGLEDWLDANAADTPGLSENNYDNDAKAKLEALLGIKSIEETQLELSTEGKLSIKAIEQSKVTGLVDALNSITDTTASLTSNVNSLTSQLTAHVKNYETLSAKVDEVDDRLTWKELS